MQSPARSADRGTGVLRRLWLLALAVGAVALCARVTFPIPGSAVPQSAQTLGVLVVGAILGARSGALALTAYLILGGLGLPVFADGASGWGHLMGPTGGYLVAFMLAAGAVGWAAENGHLHRPGSAVAVMCVGHVVILALGWLRLLWSLGLHSAYEAGVEPFLMGGVVKSVAAAAIVLLAGRLSTGHSDSSYSGSTRG